MIKNLIKNLDDIKIGTELNMKIHNEIRKAKVIDIKLEAYISDYKVVVKYLDVSTSIVYTDFINSFLEKIVFDEMILQNGDERLT